jgi:hypothetical protein
MTNNTTNKKCTTECGTCNHVDAKKTVRTPQTYAKKLNETPLETKSETARSYSFYSKLLSRPFDTLAELDEAEVAYLAQQKAKEDAATQKKADAQKVEDAFKALNAARKTFKEELTQLTAEYSDALADLKKAFDLGKKDIHNTLANAEETYAATLKEFTSKYDNYHFTIKDGDFETTISGSTNANNNTKTTPAESASTKVNKTTDPLENIFNIFNSLYGF